MEFKDYYRILGVAEDANNKGIKTAYRKLARKYHPDVSEHPDAEEKFKEAGEADLSRKVHSRLAKLYSCVQDFNY